MSTDPIDVRGTGPLNAQLMVVGEAYGQREEMAGAPFVGTSGDELNRYLSSIRISRDSVYVTNVVNERPPGNSDPTREMIERHSARLGDELLTVRPRYVLALGRYALQWFCGPEASITREWGIPRQVSLCGDHGLPFAGAQRCAFCDEADTGTWSVVLVSAHHPAYGLYMPDDQVLIQEALEGRMELTWGLRRVMDGKLAPHPPVDQYPNPEYRELTNPDEIELILGAAKVIALDTEGSPSRPWCISVCAEPGKAYVIAASNRECVAALAAWLDRYDPLVVMHFATHDIEVLAAMGIVVRRLADTMLIAHLLGPMFSQALKLGAYRELGMHMRDYTDLTRDADRERAVEYLEQVLVEKRCPDCRGRGVRAWRVPATTKSGYTKVIPAGTRRVMTKLGPVVKHVPEKVINYKPKLIPAHYESGVCETCDGDGTTWPVPRALPVWDKGRLTLWQPSPVGKRVRRILDDVRAGKVNKDGEPTDPRVRWEGADPPEAIEPVIKVLGPMPTATLDMVPRREAVDYAARDSDGTLRRWLLLDPLIDTWGLRETYNTDIAIIPLIVDMQRAGMQVDRPYFAQLSSEWRAEMSRIRHRLQKLVGYYVNPASSKQVANLLFVKLGLTPVKQTRSKESESTDDKVLEQLLLTTKHANPVAHEAITLITRHREIHKLDGTYADPLSKVESSDGRVRMEFRYTRTPTGRLSSAKPRSGQNKRNFIQGQNIPTRTDEGKRIRKGIVAKPGCLITSHDLCLAPETRVLTADLRWVPIESIQEGERLVAIEEYATGGVERLMRTAVVEKKSYQWRDCYEIKTSDGKTIIASKDHPWLVVSHIGSGAGNLRWIPTASLIPGHKLSKLVEPWETDNSREAGWLAGIFDGEGSFNRKGGMINLTQNPGEIMTAAGKALSGRGYEFHEPYSRLSGFTGKNTSQHIWMCGMADCMHFLGTIRPLRFMQNVEQLWEGKQRPRMRKGKKSPTGADRVKVVSVTHIGTHETVSIQTSTRTFVAEGFFTHNSQIEWRVMAHLSQDPNLLRVFREGHDLHRMTASLIWKIPLDQVTASQRSSAKNIGFGMGYKITWRGLQQQFAVRGIELTRDEAQAFIDGFMAAYPGIPRYWESVFAEARRNGFVRHPDGRIRWATAIRCTASWVREAAERELGNSPVQGFAAWIMKRIMIATSEKVIKPLRSAGFDVKVLLVVHDSIEQEIPDGVEAMHDPLMRRVMRETVKLSVPVLGSGAWGPRWSDCKE